MEALRRRQYTKSSEKYRRSADKNAAAAAFSRARPPILTPRQEIVDGVTVPVA
jgi:hypothetical protein